MTHHQTIRNSCYRICESVRTSNLNFSYTETPYSLYFTIRKSLVKLNNPISSSNQVFGRTTDAEKSHSSNHEENDDLVISVRKENVKLKERLNAMQSNLDASEDMANRFEAELGLLHDKLRRKDLEVK